VWGWSVSLPLSGRGGDGGGSVERTDGEDAAVSWSRVGGVGDGVGDWNWVGR